MNLRPYQISAAEAINRRLKEVDSVLLVLATGLGKTVVFAKIIEQWLQVGHRVLVLAHRKELLRQASAKLLNVGVTSEIEQGPNRAMRRTCVVASVMSMARRLDRYPPDAFSLIVIDEAHRTAAASYRSVLDHFAGAKVLGVTATPNRADGIHLGYDEIAYRYDIVAAIQDGWLAPIQAKCVTTDLDLSDASYRYGDYSVGDLGAAVSKVHKQAATPILDLSENRRTVVFVPTVECAQELALALNARQRGCSAAVWGDMPSDDRDRITDTMANGGARIIVNVNVLTEGWDQPEVSCIAILRPTCSSGLYLQMIGRGTRKHPGKENLLVLDFHAHTTRHRLANAPSAIAGTDLDPDAIYAEGGDLLSAVKRAKNRQQEQYDKVYRVATERFLAEEVDIVTGAPLHEFVGKGAYCKVCKLSALKHIGAATDPMPADPATIQALSKLGYRKIPAGIPLEVAERILSREKRRYEQGLATYKQLRQLKKHGFAPATLEDMSRKRAQQLIYHHHAKFTWNRR